MTNKATPLKELQDEMAGALKHTMSIEDAARRLMRELSTANLWKVGIGEPMSTNVEWMWIIAPDLAAVARTVEEWMETTGWVEDSPLDRIVAAELISEFVHASANVITEGDCIKWDTK